MCTWKNRSLELSWEGFNETGSLVNHRSCCLNLPRSLCPALDDREANDGVEIVYDLPGLLELSELMEGTSPGSSSVISRMPG